MSALARLLQAILRFIFGTPLLFPVPPDYLAAEEAVRQSLSERILPTQQLPPANPTKSFWIDSPGVNKLAREGSTGPITEDADVVIIGSGITGVSAAYHLTGCVQQKTKVVILEARDFCSGATGRNGGHLTPATFQNFLKNKTIHGEESALKALAIEQYTVSSLLSLIHAHDLSTDVDLVSSGHVDILATPSDFSRAKADFVTAQRAGADICDVKWLTADEMRDTYGTPHPGVRAPGHNLWPLKLVTQLFGLAQARAPHLLSLALHTRTPVTHITAVPASDASSRRYTVHTSRGPIATTCILHATNAYTARLLPQFSGRIVPVRGQIVALREYDVKGLPKMANGQKEAWGNGGSEYWFPRPTPGANSDLSEKHKHCKAEGGESPLIILGGGREIMPQFEVGITDDTVVNPKVGRMLRAFLPSVFSPEEDWDTRCEWEWTGIMGFSALGDPFVGPVLDEKGESEEFKGQFIAAGYSGHGMPRAYACAEVSAQLIARELAGGDSEWKVPQWLPEHYLTWNRCEVKKGRT